MTPNPLSVTVIVCFMRETYERCLSKDCCTSVCVFRRSLITFPMVPNDGPFPSLDIYNIRSGKHSFHNNIIAVSYRKGIGRRTNCANSFTHLIPHRL